jgi:mannose-6-phosphate isomerase-like protein (cupin superfamily)
MNTPPNTKNHAGRRDPVTEQPYSVPKPYKRSPALTNSRWYKGILLSHMAGTADTNGVFDVLIDKMRWGTEPPPHIHWREDEFFYILSGEIRFYVNGAVLAATAGECVFLPRRKPHAFLITSEEIHMINFITPGGFVGALIQMSAPAERMELPRDIDTATYANTDLAETAKVLEQYGVRLLTAEEIHVEMPEYPSSCSLLR